MKRTQLYLDDAMAKILETPSRQRGTAISELVRKSLAEHYNEGSKLDRPALARELTGIWSERNDLKGIHALARRRRRSNRLRRLGIV